MGGIFLEGGRAVGAEECWKEVSSGCESGMVRSRHDKSRIERAASTMVKSSIRYFLGQLLAQSTDEGEFTRVAAFKMDPVCMYVPYVQTVRVTDCTYLGADLSPNNDCQWRPAHRSALPYTSQIHCVSFIVFFLDQHRHLYPNSHIHYNTQVILIKI